MAHSLRPLWEALAEAARALDEEAGGVTEVLDRLETALDRKSLKARVAGNLGLLRD
jgi:hypothetical protein